MLENITLKRRLAAQTTITSETITPPPPFATNDSSSVSSDGDEVFGKRNENEDISLLASSIPDPPPKKLKIKKKKKKRTKKQKLNGIPPQPPLSHEEITPPKQEFSYSHNNPFSVLALEQSERPPQNPEKPEKPTFSCDADALPPRNNFQIITVPISDTMDLGIRELERIGNSLPREDVNRVSIRLYLSLIQKFNERGHLSNTEILTLFNVAKKLDIPPLDRSIFDFKHP